MVALRRVEAVDARICDEAQGSEPPAGASTVSSRRERTTGSGVPKAAAARFSLYLRYLESLERAGERTTSSQQLGSALGVTAAQVRKDLGYFGQLGFPGVGYKIADLVPAIRRVLGTDRSWKVALVGIGNLGSALVRYRGFERQGFVIAALFDSSDKIIGTLIDGRRVHALDSLDDIVEREQIELGIVAVPADAAQSVADRLVAAGIRGIFNFAPSVLSLPESVAHVSIDLAVELEQLTFAVSQQSAQQSAAKTPAMEAAEGAEAGDPRRGGGPGL